MVKDKNYKTATLANLGLKLPIGFQGGSDFSVRTWTAREEIAVGEAIGEGGSVGHYCEAVLGVLLGHFGGLKIWEGDKRLVSSQEFSIALQGAWTADVLTAYAALRLKSNPAPLKLTLRDPDDRGKPFDFLADLGSLEIRLPLSGIGSWDYKLLNPVTMGGKKITKLVMGPQKWQSIGAALDNEVLARLNVIAASIRGIPDFDERVEDASIDMICAMGLSKPDISALADGIEERGIGPVFSAEAKSPKTKRAFDVSIPWRYGDFFG